MDIISKFKDIIPEVVERFSAIEVLYLFGSYVSGSASVNSDLDVAMFVNEVAYIGNPLIDLEVGCMLEGYLGKAVDVVVMNRVSPIMQHEILRTGRRLFERSGEKRCAFELKSFKEYVDAKYYQQKRWNRGGAPAARV